MRPDLTFLARIYVEFPSGFRVGTGIRSHEDDNLILTDANGLPFIPGTSLTGAFLSHLRATGWDSAKLRCLFGFQNSASAKGAKYPEGRGARLTVSHAHLLNAQGEVMDGVPATFLDYTATPEVRVELTPESAQRSPILASAMRPVLRDHVRINERGVAAHRGKFTRSHIAGGHRFAFALTLEGTEEDRGAWIDLLNAWRSGAFSLGGATRQGLGRFQTVLIRQRMFNFRDAKDWEAWKTVSPNLRESETLPVHWSVAQPGPDVPAGSVSFRLQLQAQGFWLFGGSMNGNIQEGLKGPVRFQWKDKKNGRMSVVGHDQPQQVSPVVPFTSIKGPLRHRVVYHYNRLASHWATETADNGLSPGDLAARQLFGWVSDKPGSKEAFPGVFLGEDASGTEVDSLHDKQVDHVALDPFTGGPIPGALFSERPHFGGGFLWQFRISDTAPFRSDPRLLEALVAALRDLGSGDLAVGKGSGKGRFLASADELQKVLQSLQSLVDPVDSNPETAHA